MATRPAGTDRRVGFLGPALVITSTALTAVGVLAAIVWACLQDGKDAAARREPRPTPAPPAPVVRDRAHDVPRTVPGRRVAGAHQRRRAAAPATTRHGRRR